MANIDPYKVDVDIGTLRYNGIIDLPGLFKTARSWIVSNKFTFFEKTLKHKIYPEGYKKEIEWWAWKKVNDYITFHITLAFLIREINEVEVVRHGQKQKLQQCIFQVEVKGYVELDRKQRFGGKGASPFLSVLRNFYHNYIIKEDILFHWGDQFTYRLLKLHQTMKDYMEYESKTNAAEFRW